MYTYNESLIKLFNGIFIFYIVYFIRYASLLYSDCLVAMRLWMVGSCLRLWRISLGESQSPSTWSN